MKKGFKHTEIGWIPEDWEVRTIFDSTVCLDNLRVPLNENQRLCMKGDYPYCGANGILDYINDYIIEDEVILIAEDGGYFEEYETRPIAYKMKGKFWVNNHAHILKAKSDFDQDFIFYSLVHKNILPYLTSGTRSKLNKSEMYKIGIAIPNSKSEQTAIAQVLSDTDALIEKLEQLIAKKQNIKTAAMQELLKPKEGWVVKKLGEVCKRITTGKLDANAMKPDGEYRFYTCAKNYFFIDNYAFDDEALLISGNGEYVGYVHYYKGKFNAYQRTYVLTGFSIDVLFLKYYLDNFLAARIDVEIYTGNTPYIRRDTLTEMNIYFPKEQSEQTRIAQILTDMDNEIEALEEQLEKYKMLKRGMMQVLLTGKIRLNLDYEGLKDYLDLKSRNHGNQANQVNHVSDNYQANQGHGH